MPEIKELRLVNIRIDGGLQTRAALHDGTIKDYAEAMENGAEFPPLSVLFDGEAYWLWDGFHRHHAYRQAGIGECECSVTEGAKDDALTMALASNATHGLPRSNADKRSAVTIALKQWPDWSDNKIAEACVVSQPFVGKVRKDTQPITVISSPRVGQDGKTRKMPERAPREPGDESEPEGEEPLPFEPRSSAVSEFFDGKKTKSKAVGKTHFDDTVHDKLIGPLVRFYQSRAEVKNCVACPEHKRLGELCDQLIAEFEKWQKRVAA